ncbi:MAG: hypothetical protein AAFV98_14745 [Chloroflexota bacterium]
MAHMSVSKKRTNRHLQEMMLIFDFTAEDLVENRDGFMTERQSAKMQRAGVTSIVAIWGVALFIGIPLVGMFFGMIYPPLSDANVGFFIHLLLWAVMVGLPLAFAGFAGWATYKHFTTRKHNVVSSLEGTVKTHISRVRRDEFYDMTIRGEQFHLTADMYTLIRSGQAYRVYYVPSNKHIASMEPVTNE